MHTFRKCSDYYDSHTRQIFHCRPKFWTLCTSFHGSSQHHYAHALHMIIQRNANNYQEHMTQKISKSFLIIAFKVNKHPHLLMLELHYRQIFYGKTLLDGKPINFVSPGSTFARNRLIRIHGIMHKNTL